MELIKLTNKQKELLEHKVKPLLTNDLSFNIELIKNILDIDYEKYYNSTIVNYTKEHIVDIIKPSESYGCIDILNLNKDSIYTHIEIRNNIAYVEIDNTSINIYTTKQRIAHLNKDNTYIIGNISIQLKNYKNYNIKTNTFDIFLLS